jgi:hypothetical protein
MPTWFMILLPATVGWLMACVVVASVVGWFVRVGSLGGDEVFKLIAQRRWPE